MNDITHLPDEVGRALKAACNKKTLDSGNRFFKKGEQTLRYGVTSPIVNKIAKKYFHSLKDLPKGEVFNLCEVLWRSGYLEEGVVACTWAYAQRSRFEDEDFPVFEEWLEKYVDNWASCDTLCNHTLGDFVMMYPHRITELKKWARSRHRWLKRGAAVTLIIPARKGRFTEDVFEIADILLTDTDDLVQKGYGWMLKACSEAYQDRVFEYIISRKDQMSRTALRYAIEKMPPDLRKEAMKK